MKKRNFLLIIAMLFLAQIAFAGTVKRTGSPYYQIIGRAAPQTRNTEPPIRTNCYVFHSSPGEPPLLESIRHSHWDCETRFDLRSPQARAWYEVNRKNQNREIISQSKCVNGCNKKTGRCHNSQNITQKCRAAFLGCTEYKENTYTGDITRGSSRYYPGRKCNRSTGNCERKT